MRFSLLLAIVVALPAFAQPSPSATHHFRYDLMVSLDGAYLGGGGLDAEVQVADHLRARAGVGVITADPWRDTVDAAGRLTLLGTLGGQRLEAQGGAGLSLAYTTESLSDALGQYAGVVRQTSVVPHLYAGVRSVLAIGADEPGRRASAPRLSVRAGALLTTREPGPSGAARLRPEVGFGFAF